MNSQPTVLDLPKFIKSAREKSCLGLYADSLKVYYVCLKIIQEYLLILL